MTAPDKLHTNWNYPTAMRVGPGRFFAKTGAEGSYGIAVFGRELGIALKIEDGAARAVDPAAVEVLRQCGALGVQEVQALRRFHRPRVLNHRREEVGEISGQEGGQGEGRRTRRPERRRSDRTRRRDD